MDSAKRYEKEKGVSMQEFFKGSPEERIWLLKSLEVFEDELESLLSDLRNGSISLSKREVSDYTYFGTIFDEWSDAKKYFISDFTVKELHDFEKKFQVRIFIDEAISDIEIHPWPNRSMVQVIQTGKHLDSELLRYDVKEDDFYILKISKKSRN